MIEQYLDEIPLPLPVVVPAENVAQTAIKENPEEVFINENEKQHTLTNFIRNQYLGYVRKILKENYQHWMDADPTNNSGLIVRCLITFF